MRNAVGAGSADDTPPLTTLTLVLRGKSAAAAAERFADDLGPAARELGLDLAVVTAETFREVERIDEDAAILFLFAGDVFDHAALNALARGLRRDTELLVFDMACPATEGRMLPLLQPGANRALLSAVDAVFSRFLIRGRTLTRVLRTRPRPTPRQLMLEALNHLGRDGALDRFAHLAAPLVEIPDVRIDIERERAARRARIARVDAPTAAGDGASVVISTRDKGFLLHQLLQALTSAEARPREILIVANQTRNAHALETQGRWSTHPGVRLVRYDEPFNFSRQANLGAELTQGQRIVFMNDDITPAAPNWMHHLLRPLDDESVAISGALLLHDDERVQHSGMFLGFNRTAGHVLRDARLPERDYFYTASAPRDASCVTGAVMAVRRADFEALGGFDESLTATLQDVDLCLRARAEDRRVVFTPDAVFFHFESVSVREALSNETTVVKVQAEQDAFVARHGERLAIDPFFNPSYATDSEGLRRLVCAAAD